MRRVKVYWWRGTEKVPVGELAQGETTPIVFEWAPEMLRNDIELSPIRFKKSPGLIECPARPFDGLPGLFADHIPDGWGRILIRRGLIEQGVGFDNLSSLDMLCYIGDSAMGALSFEPRLERGELWAQGEVKLDSLEKGVGPILEGTPSDVLSHFLSGGVSPNGMRPKVLAKEKEGRFYIGQAELDAQEWLIKFRSPGDSKESGQIEYLYSLMARDAGVEVPETRLFETKKGFFFGSKRFDRVLNERHHLHTLSGLLHISPGNFSVGYEHFAKVALALTADYRAVKSVFSIATFNILACNQDDHARNVSFLMDKDGKWRVSPAYDLTFCKNPGDEHKMWFFGKGKPTATELLFFGQELGLSKTVVRDIVDRTKEALSQFPRYARDLALSREEAKRIGSALPGAKEVLRRGAKPG